MSEIKRIVTVKVCLLCNSIIDTSGLCSYDCPQDGALCRDLGTAVRRVYERTDRLLKEEPLVGIDK